MSVRELASGDLSRVANLQAFGRTSRMSPDVSKETMTQCYTLFRYDMADFDFGTYKNIASYQNSTKWISLC